MHRCAAHQGEQHDPRQVRRNQHLPAELHHLVVAHARNRCPHPRDGEDHDLHLEDEPQQRPPALIQEGAVQRPRCVETAEEQRHRHRRDGRDVDVLGEEVERVTEAGVVGDVSRNQFRFAFGHVERLTVGLAEHRNVVDDETRQQQQAVPARQRDRGAEQIDRLRLSRDDLAGRHRPRVHEDRDQGQTHGDLVADHLRGGAHRAEQRIGAVGRPAGQHEAVEADAGDGHDQQGCHRQIGQLQPGLDPEHPHRAAQRDDRPGGECGDRGQHRCDVEHQRVGAGRAEVLLEEQLHAVAERLAQAEGAVHDRALAVLHLAEYPALEPHVEDGPGQQQDEDAHHLDQDEPPRIVEEDRFHAGHAAPPAVLTTASRTRSPGRACSVRNNSTPELVGAQTTSSTIEAVTAAGSTTSPLSVPIITGSPSRTPSAAAVAGEIRASGAGAVSRRVSAPSRQRESSIA
ncbi:hypothetical protein SDC9_110131 [bioreactor metagenome]|uniref:Uncharacterized protein n=1 Tax=bioreactor metagenome TaxID=1076179 RepID=A0A645BF15_9ZZZZ